MALPEIKQQEGAKSSTAITAFGVVALTFMMVMYGLERRHAGFVLGFAAGLPPLKHLWVLVGHMAVRGGRADPGWRGRSTLRGRDRLARQ